MESWLVYRDSPVAASLPPILVFFKYSSLIVVKSHIITNIIISIKIPNVIQYNHQYSWIKIPYNHQSPGALDTAQFGLLEACDWQRSSKATE